MWCDSGGVGPSISANRRNVRKRRVRSHVRRSYPPRVSARGSRVGRGADRRASSRSTDAVLAPVEPVIAAARDLAVQRGLPPDWLNDAVKAYVPPVGSEDWVELIREGDLTVSIASAELLLAIKLYANRGRRDTEDIEYLLGACGVTSLEEAQAIYERYHAQDLISDSAALRVQAWLSRRDP